VLGLGWSLDLPAIERSSRAGIPRMDGPVIWQLRHLGDGEELTETTPGASPATPAATGRRAPL
jgi:hypothetical protein